MKRFMKIAGLAVAGLVLVCVVAAAVLYSNYTKPLTIQGTGIFASKPVWSFSSPDAIITSPVIGGNKVYVRTDKGIQVLDGLTGKLLDTLAVPWKARDTLRPMLYDNWLFVPALDGQLVAFQPDSSVQAWKACPKNSNCGHTDFYMPIETETYSLGVLVVTRHSDRLTAYDAVTGNILWDEDIPDRDFTDVAASGDMLYKTEMDSLSAYDIYTGKQLWSEEVYYGGRVLVQDDTAYFVSGYDTATRIIAFDVNSRKVKWTVPISTREVTIQTYLALDHNTLLVTSDSIVAIDISTGKVLWESDHINNLLQAAIGDNKVFVRDRAGTLYAFDESSGKQIGQLMIQRNPTGEVLILNFLNEMGTAIFDDMVIVPLAPGTIIAYPLR